MAILLQLILVGLWGTALVIHTRRLFRLASVSVTRGPLIRQKARRIWWWLGRDEFWQATSADMVRCLELTLLVVFLAWMF